jgi:hypothetical protein
MFFRRTNVERRHITHAHTCCCSLNLEKLDAIKLAADIRDVNHSLVASLDIISAY